MLVACYQNIRQVIYKDKIQQFFAGMCDSPTIFGVMLHNQAMGLCNLLEAFVVVGIATAGILDRMNVGIVMAHLMQKGSADTGTLVQGKQGTPHYKIKQMEQRPASEWVRVPDAHEALIARQDFELVQRIKGLDTRTSPNEDTVYLFSGILICGCCGSRMTRKTNRANSKEYHYYYCPTGKKKGCTHPVMLKESSLIDCVRDSLKAYIGNIASLEALLTGIDQTSINQALAKEYSDHITDNERRLEQVLEFKARLYESLVGGMLTKEEYASYKAKYTKQAEDIRESVRVLREKLTEVLENRSERNRWISQFTQFSTLETLDRRALIHMVQSIRVRGKKELDITFTHEDEYKKALQLLSLAAQQKDYEQRKVG